MHALRTPLLYQSLYLLTFPSSSSGIFTAAATFRDLSCSKFEQQAYAKTSKQAVFSNSALLAALWKVSEAFCHTLKALNLTMSTRCFRGESTFKMNCSLGEPGIELKPNVNWPADSTWYFYSIPNRKVTIFVSYLLNQNLLVGKISFIG